ncbi:MAG: galactokinase [Brevefilum sp.]|nr:galactokinase [Brevefilum sp.]
MEDILKEKVGKKFRNLFGADPEFLVFAPGRVNLIGEHTDYSDGFVLPFAINLGIVLAFSPTNNDQIDIHAIDFDQLFSQKVSKNSKGPADWTAYIKGVIWALKSQIVQLKGFQGVVAGNLPIGAGLSSSAALEVVAAKALCASSDVDISSPKLAQICQRAERGWVGVNVGIMDQLISACGKRGHAVKLDCRTLDTEYVLIPDGIRFIVLDTNTRRELSHSAYNKRSEEVEWAAQILKVRALRDASLSMLIKEKDKFPSTIYRRARHVISENDRVHAFVNAMKNHDLQKMGHLLNESHISLRDDFEVSSEELNIIVDIAIAQPGCYGARMAGAGFGGCALAMVNERFLDDFIHKVQHEYKKQTNIEPHIFSVKSSDGVYLVGS